MSFSFLKNKLIVIPYNNPKSWIADYITQTANVLSEKNIVIAFLWQDALSIKEIIARKLKSKESFRFIEKKDRIIYFRPIHFLPLRRLPLIESLNLIINIYFLKIFISSKGFDKKKKILWLFHPDFWYLPKIFGKSYISYYDCVDYFSSKSQNAEIKIRRNEIKIIKNVQLMTTISKTLKKLYSNQKKNIYVVPQGFAVKDFQSYRKLPQGNFLLKLKRPIIGYVGGINERLQFPILINLAKKNPHWNFIFNGPIQNLYYHQFKSKLNQLKKLKNVYFQEFDKKDYIPSVIKQFDICLIPYDISQDFNRYCYPMKVFEYFYLGKPIISTPIEELKQFFPLIKIASDTNDFNKSIKEILKNGWPLNYARKQKALALDNTWEKKIKKIDKILEQNDF